MKKCTVWYWYETDCGSGDKGLNLALIILQNFNLFEFLFQINRKYVNNIV